MVQPVPVTGDRSNVKVNRALMEFVLRRHPFDRPIRRICHFDKLDTFYVENQKSGCSTWKYILYKANQGDDTLTWKRVKKLIIRMKDELEAMSYGDIEPLVEDSSKYKFTFVRNPYKRLFSCWVDKFHFWLHDPNIDELTRARKIQFVQSRMGLSGDDYELSFERFVDMVTEQAAEDMDKHWMPQSYALGVGGGFPYDFIGKLEHFDRDFAEVARHVNLDGYSLRQLNKKSKTVEIDDVMTDAVKNRIYAKFEADFDLLEYPREL